MPILARLWRLGTGLLIIALARPVQGAELTVGPGEKFLSIGAALRAAAPGDAVLVRAGSYPGDVALINKDGLSLRAVGGRVDIDAAGRSIEGKGIFVVRAHGVLIEGFSFRNATVPDRNGAGIRFDSGSLTVRDCLFFDNQAGLLAGNDPQSMLRVEHSEFARNGVGDGQTHALYAGRIRKLTVIGSYFHHGLGGQLIKSRAEDSEVLYNRLTDERGGRSSYELEFPNGGHARVVGNIIQQSPTTENRTMISFGVEGYAWPTNELTLIHNTLDDQRSFGGQYLFIKAGPVAAFAYGNLLIGGADQLQAESLKGSHNVRVSSDQLANREAADYRLRSSATVLHQAPPWPLPAPLGDGPSAQYRHPRTLTPLTPPARHPGALQELAAAR